MHGDQVEAQVRGAAGAVFPTCDAQHGHRGVGGEPGGGAEEELIEHEIARARAKGFSRVHLDVMSDNPAVGLYRAMGFEPMAETVTPIPCREHGLAMELRMMLRL